MRLTARLKQQLWHWYGSGQFPAEWDGEVGGGGKISQRFWEYFIAIEMLDLCSGAVIVDIGGGSPATGINLFPRLLASAGVQVIVFDVNVGHGAVQETVPNLSLEYGLADYKSLCEALVKYTPTHLSCISVLEHASPFQQRGIFDAIESAFEGERAVLTFEFHENQSYFEEQLTTASLSNAVSGVRRYYLNRLERSPMRCTNAFDGSLRLWYPLALQFERTNSECLSAPDKAE
jgi:hypothetical protein